MGKIFCFKGKELDIQTGHCYKSTELQFEHRFNFLLVQMFFDIPNLEFIQENKKFLYLIKY